MRSIEWAAGFFEGEGCISLQRQKRNGKIFTYMSLHLSSTDEDVVRSFVETVGIGKVRFEHSPSARARGVQATYGWRVYNKKALEVGWRLYPYMHGRRKAKWLECVAEVERMREL